MADPVKMVKILKHQVLGVDLAGNRQRADSDQGKTLWISYFSKVGSCQRRYPEYTRNVAISKDKWFLPGSSDDIHLVDNLCIVPQYIVRKSISSFLPGIENCPHRTAVCIALTVNELHGTTI